MVKFLVDTAILGLMLNNADVLDYKSTIQSLVQWCDEHFLIHTVKKMVGMVFVTDKVHAGELLQIPGHSHR